MTPDAADMGGQAGEEVLAVVTLGGLFHGGSGPELGDIDIEPDMRALERVQCELVNSSDDTHIELIDRRILAQHRQQAGKLVEALRIIQFRADCFVEDDMDMRVPSIKAIVRIAGEALAARDVKP